MGYKYGVWIVLKNKDLELTVKHIPHITLMCNMCYENAFHYYRELLWRGYSKLDVIIHRPVIVFPKMYKEDLLDAWGYYVTMHPKTYLDMETIAEKYKGDFSNNPHLSIQYDKEKGDIYKGRSKIQGTICLVDITSDDPSLWRIII